MREETDSVDLFTAFAIGAMIGVGATLLLRPDPPPSRSEQILRQLRPVARKARRAARRAGREYVKTIARGQRATRHLGDSGKEVLDDFREQVEEILSSAREELSDTARKQFKNARKALKRRLA